MPVHVGHVGQAGHSGRPAGLWLLQAGLYRLAVLVENGRLARLALSVTRELAFSRVNPLLRSLAMLGDDLLYRLALSANRQAKPLNRVSGGVVAPAQPSGMEPYAADTLLDPVANGQGVDGFPAFAGEKFGHLFDGQIRFALHLVLPDWLTDAQNIPVIGQSVNVYFT